MAGVNDLLAGMFFFLFLLFLGLYIFSSLALMSIAQKTKTKDPWLAWIPIANIYLMTQIAGMSGWWTLSILLGVIPFIGALATIAIFTVIWWKIAEARDRPGWWALLISFVPIVNLVMIGILAWGE